MTPSDPEGARPAIYVDADACPVKQEIYKAAGKYGLVVHVVANAFMNTPLDERIRLVVVGKDPDAADDWIAAHAETNDIVVTADIPLADRCVKKGARVLDMRGDEFTPDSIGGAVATRELMAHLREMGAVTGGPPPVAKKDRSKFSSKLHEVIQAVLRGN
ncbi:MAG: YaiI/YqxD family protein [Deltaproteobacteria bacterium]|nr:YaiI/YqxD family protein [Deltaproteobacteria bacterium]